MGPLAALLVALLCVPALSVVTQATTWEGGVYGHLAETVLAGYLGGTFALMALVLPGVLLVGGGCAWLVARYEFPGRRALEWALLFPFAAPAYVLAYVYTDALQGVLASVRGMTGAALLFVFTGYPYVYLLGRASFLEQSPRLVEAARLLGSGPAAALRRVAFPLARPSLVAGAAMALMEVAADFGTVEYFAVDTLSTGVFRTWFGLGSKAGAAGLSVLLLACAFALLSVERSARGRARYFNVGHGAAGGSVADAPRGVLRGTRAALATIACSIPFAVGFAIPAALLSGHVADGGWRHVDAEFFAMASRTFALAVGAGALACAVGLVVAWAARARASALDAAGGSARAPSRSRAAEWGASVASLGYAVPGAVLAVGILFPLGAVDTGLAEAWEGLTGKETGLLFGGTVAALLYAYVVRFGAIPLQGFQAALGRVSPSMEASARVLGATSGQCLRRIHAPLVARSAAAAFVLVLVDVVKELPATLILRPLSFDTLAVHTYNLASDERLAEASPAALCIVAVGMIPVYVLHRRARSERRLTPPETA